jgi:hypothetical protein
MRRARMSSLRIWTISWTAFGVISVARPGSLDRDVDTSVW